MSKIGKALAKAKKSRASQVREVDKLRLHPQSPDRASSTVQHPPVYSQTRVVSLDNNHLEKHRLSALLDDPLAIDSYNVLCTQFLNRTLPKGHNTVMVTSSLASEGKTVTAISLAISIARRVQHTALLVDGDLRNPSITNYLGLDGAKGLSDYLVNDNPISELLINPGLPSIVVLPAGKPLHSSAELLGSPKMERLVQELKNRYPERYVIFDSPPLLGVPDTLVLCSHVDGIILVVEAGKTPKEQILQSIGLLNEEPLLGLAMNKYKVGRNGYYYYGYGR